MILLRLISACFILALAAGPSWARDPVVLAFGDSLTAGYGLEPANAFPVQLERALRRQGMPATVVNGGVSGDTSTGGRARLLWLLESAAAAKPDLVIVELGANDALRGIDPAVTRDNLDWIIRTLRQRDIAVILAGMMAPPNLGSDYGKAFNGLYPALAKKHGVPLYGFFLDGVAAEPAYLQEDGMHPNEKGAARIAARLAPLVARELKRGQR
ncbi:MAG: arylesterase [Sphingomonadales bacterium]|nr:arylesterase [Sphingomonadales bacterium]